MRVYVRIAFMEAKNREINMCKARKGRESGNAMVYVLIVVALFAAITFVLSRQTDSTETDALSDEQAEILASNIQQSAMSLKQSVEQMTWTGTNIDDLDFVMPSDGAAFDAGSHVDKVFHPAGGNVSLPRIPDNALNETNTNPPARWYIGRFNNVGWTPTTAQDVILTAHQLNNAVCRRLNLRLTGDDTIPTLLDNVRRLVILSSETSPDPGNISFTSAECPECYGKPALCVLDTTNGVNTYSFYSIVGAQ